MCTMERHIITEPPEGFIYYQTWPEYKLASDFVNGKEIFANIPGVRLGAWPFILERYYSDTEPDYKLANSDETAPSRVIIWQRIFNKNIPTGWYCPRTKERYLEGFAKVSDDYYGSWSVRAREERNRWLKHFNNQAYRIETLSFAEFAEAYANSTVIQKVHRYYIESLNKKLAQGAIQFIDFRGVREQASGKLVGGIACLNSPTHKSSYYHTGFYLDIVKKDPVMIGLMDDWFSRATEKEYQYLFLGLFQKPDTLGHMRDYSFFKSKFCPYFVSLPPPLVRPAKGNLVGDGLTDYNIMSVLRSLV